MSTATQKRATVWEYDRKADVLYAVLDASPESDDGADETPSGVFIYRAQDGQPARLVVMSPDATKNESGILIDDAEPFYLELPPEAERRA